MPSSENLGSQISAEDLQRQLFEKEAELEKLREEYANFAYIVSHDLSAPMRHIDGFTALVIQNMEGRLDDKTEQYLGFLKSSANRAADIMSGLLEFSRLTTRQKAFAEIDCNELVSDVLAKLDTHIQKTAANITVEELPRVMGDVDQVEKIFFHLLANALIYHKAGVAPQVDIRARVSGDLWEFCISDQGMGIRENRQGEVFSVLRRGVGESDFPGLGMGLAIARKVVMRHGGKIWLNSVPDEGTSVHFTFPRTELSER